jgi:endo-1,4-beta-xylanase
MKNKPALSVLQTFLASFLILLLFSPLPARSENSLLLQTDFEDGTAQGWTGRGGVETLAVVPEAARGGSYGLRVGDREQSWHGPTLDVTAHMEPGQTYVFTGWIKLPQAAPATTVYMTMQRRTPSTTHYERMYFDTATSSGWVRFQAQYELLEAADNLSVYFEAPDNSALVLYIDDFRLEKMPDLGPVVIEEGIPSLKDVFAEDFLIGTAFSNSELMTEADRKLLAKHFNSTTPGNVLKWDSTEPREGVFDFSGSDAAVQFAAGNGQRIRGHTLVWHSQTPDWVFRDANGNLASKELLFQRMKTHINAVMGRYKGQIYAWDVVNEVLDAAQPDGLRRSPWYQIAGEEFIEKAFLFAREADPDALLFINDYNTHESGKSQAMYDLVKRLKARGIPIDGVGHQTHVSLYYPTVQEIESSIVKFAGLGVETHITELDMSVYSASSQRYDTFPDELKQKQASLYKQLFDVFRRHKGLITSVTLWGKDDGNTWLRTFPVARNDWPLLFDERLQSKPAYWALVNVPVPPASNLALQYRAADTQPGDNGSRPHFKIKNNGGESVRLSELAIRYWFTVDGEKPLAFFCDYARIGSANVIGRHVKMSTGKPGADHYLEITFDSAAGSLPAGGDSGEIETRSHKADWSNFDESNDYSFDPSKTSFTPWEGVTLYRNGQLIWGTEP